MKKATWFAACLLLCSSQVFAADYFGTRELPKVKETKALPAQPVQPPVIGQGGDNFGSATPIPALPYANAGNSCGFTDDYYPPCAFGGNSTASDVVYSYTPTTDECINVSLCGSGYDTILHIYDNTGLIACSEDDCGLQSVVEGLSVTAGVTYYIVVDGYATACGSYVINIDRCPPPCDLNCPPDGVAEGEPVCTTDYTDATNGGCNSVPPVYTNLTCDDTGVTVCGTYGNYTFQGSNFRDTDWYQIQITSPTNLQVCVCGGAPTQLAIVDASTGCSPVTVVCGSVFGDPNESVCCQVALNPGTYWIFVAPSVFAGVACGTPYTMTINGYNCPPVAVEPADWTGVKTLFR